MTDPADAFADWLQQKLDPPDTKTAEERRLAALEASLTALEERPSPQLPDDAPPADPLPSITAIANYLHNRFD